MKRIFWTTPSPLENQIGVRYLSAKEASKRILLITKERNENSKLHDLFCFESSFLHKTLFAHNCTVNVVLRPINEIASSIKTDHFQRLQVVENAKRNLISLRQKKHSKEILNLFQSFLSQSTLSCCSKISSASRSFLKTSLSFLKIEEESASTLIALANVCRCEHFVRRDLLMEEKETFVGIRDCAKKNISLIWNMFLVCEMETSHRCQLYQDYYDAVVFSVKVSTFLATEENHRMESIDAEFSERQTLHYQVRRRSIKDLFLRLKTLVGIEAGRRCKLVNKFQFKLKLLRLQIKEERNRLAIFQQSCFEINAGCVLARWEQFTSALECITEVVRLEYASRHNFENHFVRSRNAIFLHFNLIIEESNSRLLLCEIEDKRFCFQFNRERK